MRQGSTGILAEKPALLEGQKRAVTSLKISLLSHISEAVFMHNSKSILRPMENESDVSVVSPTQPELEIR